jgi:hypothetical protein
MLQACVSSLKASLSRRRLVELINALIVAARIDGKGLRDPWIREGLKLAKIEQTQKRAHVRHEK